MANPNKVKGAVICFAAILFLAAAVSWAPAQAVWQEPTTSAPNGNIAAPLNISSGDQGKLGNTGIGTISPVQKLDVAGNINLSGATSRTIFYGTTGVAAPGAGSIGEKIQLYGTAGTIGSSDYALGIESSTMWFNTNGLYKWYKQSVQEMVLDSNGRLGIGASSPNKLLQVGNQSSANNPIVGSIRIEGGGNSAGNWRNWDFEVGAAAIGTSSYDTHRLRISNNGAEVATIDENGNVGIGTTSPTTKLEIAQNSAIKLGNVFISSGAANIAHFGSNGWYDGSIWHIPDATQKSALIQLNDENFYFYTTATAGGIDYTNRMSVTPTGVYSTAFFYSSDARLKTDVRKIDSSIGKIMQLNGVYFKWKDSGNPSLGLIAQDVEKVFPEIVSENPDTGLKTVDYGKLVAPLIEAVKTQQKQITNLENRIQALQNKIEALERSK